MIKKFLMACFLIMVCTGWAIAGVTQEEAAKLGGPVYTWAGAEKAGSADGLVPAWTGGITKGADGWYYEGKLKVPFSKYPDPKKDGRRPDPFADDKILFTVTAKNMAQYADKMTEGMKALMVKYPNDVKLNVYPSRRSMAYSQVFQDNARQVAVSANALNNGLTLKGAKLAFPFPFPQNGIEALWNHKVKWSGSVELDHYNAYIVSNAGRLIHTTEGITISEYPYWDPQSGKRGYDYIWLCFDNNIGPPNRVGEGTMFYMITDDTKPMPVWQYLPGQRRVKLAPQLSFDNPSTQVAGASTNDDSFMYNGSPRKYDWKLLGKKEMIVPYNGYKAVYWTKTADFMGPRYVKPDPSRYEVHRVWVVEGKLKPTERHIYKKRVLYLDEDSWQALVCDVYDHNDKLWRVLNGWIVFNYDFVVPNSFTALGYDLVTGISYISSHTAETGGIYYKPARNEKDWSPSIMAGRGIR